MYPCASLTLRDGSHGQGDGDLEVVDGTTDPGATVDGVVEMADVDGPDSDADEGDNLGQLLAELVQFSLQGSLLLLGGGHLVADLADLSGDSGGHSHTDGLASSDVSALTQGKGRER